MEPPRHPRSVFFRHVTWLRNTVNSIINMELCLGKGLKFASGNGSGTGGWCNLPHLSDVSRG